MTRRRLAFAAFALVSIALTLWIAGELTGFERGGARNAHVATFADATGLRSGDPVRVSGVPVGEVTKVGVDRGQAVVRFATDRSVALPADSVVAVRSQNLIGMRELVITPGASSRLLADGDPMEQTESSIELGALVNELGPLLETASPQQVNELVEALNQTLDGNRETIADLTGDLSLVLGSMADRAGTIEQLLVDYETLAGELADRDRHIQQLLDNLVLLTETFDASDDVLRAALGELPGFAAELDSLLDANAEPLDRLVADLASLLGHVGANAGTIGEALTGLPNSAGHLFQVAARGNALTANFQCMAVHPPPCPHPSIDGTTLAGVLQELNAP